MQWNEQIGQNCHFITLHNPIFFHVECKQPTTAKMHKIFIAQKSYCACCVLSLAAIRSKYYFNFILNRTVQGQSENFLIAPLMSDIRPSFNTNNHNKLTITLTLTNSTKFPAARNGRFDISATATPS